VYYSSEVLEISENQWNEEDLGDYTQFRMLNLANNEITALPESIRQLTQLMSSGCPIIRLISHKDHREGHRSS